MKILVTGTAGFIGYHLAKKLLERGDEVVGIDNNVMLNDEFLIFNEISINNNSKFKIHHSKLYKNPHAYIQSNVVGFLNILEGCRNNGVKNLAFASSSSVYGLNESQPFKTTDKTEHQVSLYAATKKSNEMMAHTYAHLYGIHVTGLRFFTVYGPWGRPDMAPMLFTDAILNDRAIKVFNNGEMSRDFTYIDDIVDGIVKVIDNPAKANPEWNAKEPEISSSSAPYKIYNIGNNAPLPLMTFIETLENALGKKAEKNFMPMQDGDVVSTYADVSGLINDFGYKPDTKLADGIGEFVKWYGEFYLLKEKDAK